VVQQPPPPQTHAIQEVQHADKPPVYVQHTAPAAKPADTTFSAAHIIGGSGNPGYPEQYADSQRSGRVTVDCVIQTDGRPTNCKVLSSAGGAAFASQTMHWLTGSDAPRYKPDTRGGVPVAAEHQWVVSFQAAD
jgi:protein TonB